MPPKKKGGKKKGPAEPVLTGPEAEAEMERKMLIEECKALKKQKEREDVEYNEFQQEKVRFLEALHAHLRLCWHFDISCNETERA